MGELVKLQDQAQKQRRFRDREYAFAVLIWNALPRGPSSNVLLERRFKQRRGPRVGDCGGIASVTIAGSRSKPEFAARAIWFRLLPIRAISPIAFAKSRAGTIPIFDTTSEPYASRASSRRSDARCTCQRCRRYSPRLPCPNRRTMTGSRAPCTRVFVEVLLTRISCRRCSWLESAAGTFRWYVGYLDPSEATARPACRSCPS
jgi:hypothetical protein